MFADTRTSRGSVLGLGGRALALMAIVVAPRLAGPQPALAARVSARPAGQAARPPLVPGLGAALAYTSNDRMFWSRAPYTARPIASITKVMTAMLVIQAGHLGRRIKITRAEANYVAENGASNAGLVPGDVLTAHQLLYAMMLPSGCDAAMALAISYGPGIPAFVRKMNAAARRLHLVRTHFGNFDGLLSSDRSDPRNLLLLGEAAMKLPVFRQVVATRIDRLWRTRAHHRYVWRNLNYLIGGYRGAIGIKPGFTRAAGQCLLFEATRGKRTIIGVLLNVSPVNGNVVFAAARKLLNWGFRRR